MPIPILSSSDLFNRIGRIANICVVCAVLIFVGTVMWLFLHRSSTHFIAAPIEKGTKITLVGQDWTRNSQTLLLLLSKDCKYCTASAPFYRRLIADAEPTRGTAFVAVLPQSPTESGEYLRQLEVRIDDLRQATPASLGVKGTPTLILVDARGLVIQSWAGQLPPNGEADVLRYLR